MKIFHLSDLHIGRQLNMYDLSELQTDFFEQLIAAAKKEQPDAIVIAGDIYDKSQPSGEAFKMFEKLLMLLADLNIPVMIISGNHDNDLRLGYVSEFLEKSKIYISTQLPKSENEYLKRITVPDEYGSVNFYLMPFVKPADVKNLLRDTKADSDIEISNYDDAVKAMLERESFDFSQRNVLIAHQFFVHGSQKPEVRESENGYACVGGIDSVDISCVKDFDYVALGHIHTSQKIGPEHIRYCGTPIKYSVSEAKDTKSITMIELHAKGEPLRMTQIPLTMKRDVVRLRGTLKELLQITDEQVKDAYVSITLTDEETLFKPKERLGEVFSHILEVTVDNKKTKRLLNEEALEDTWEDPLTLFNAFFVQMHGEEMNSDEKVIMQDVIENVRQDFESGDEL